MTVSKVVKVVGLAAEIHKLALGQAPATTVDRVQNQTSILQRCTSEKHQKVCRVPYNMKNFSLLYNELDSCIYKSDSRFKTDWSYLSFNF